MNTTPTLPRPAASSDRAPSVVDAPERLTPEQAGRVRFHRGQITSRTLWWVSIDGTYYLRDDYPTKAAARAAALTRLTAIGAGYPEGGRR